MALGSCSATDPRPPELLPPPTTAVPLSTIVFDSDRSGTFEIYTMAADGSAVRALTSDARFDSWWGRISPDRRRILFYRTPAGTHDRDFTRTALWMMNADGTGAVELRPAKTDGWAMQGHAEWSPDGAELVMFGGSRINPQVHVTAMDGSSPRQITRRGGVNLDPSWTPDGRRIVFVGCPKSVCFPSDQEVYIVDASGTEDAERLTDDDLADYDPYVSPDGSTLAWLTRTSDDGPVGVWNLRTASPDGSGMRWLTDDDNVNSKPEWSNDGSVIYFHRLEFGVHTGFSIFRIHPDGSGLREITRGQPGVNEYPSN